MDDLKRMYLMNAKDVKYDAKQKMGVTLDIYFKKLENDAEKKLISNDELENKFKLIEK